VTVGWLSTAEYMRFVAYDSIRCAWSVDKVAFQLWPHGLSSGDTCCGWRMVRRTVPKPNGIVFLSTIRSRCLSKCIRRTRRSHR
jgi:hypothetical protein